MSLYGRSLVALHMRFIKNLRRHKKCDMPLLNSTGQFISGWIWRLYDSGMVKVQIYESEIPQIVEYSSIDAAWMEFEKLLLEALNES